MKEFLTVKEAVAYSGIPENTIRGAVKSGRLPSKNTYKDGINGIRRGGRPEMIAIAVTDLELYMSKKGDSIVTSEPTCNLG